MKSATSRKLLRSSASCQSCKNRLTRGRSLPWQNLSMMIFKKWPLRHITEHAPWRRLTSSGLKHPSFALERSHATCPSGLLANNPSLELSVI